MFDQRNFVACIQGQLAERGFGAKRQAEILDRFHGLTEQFQTQGYGGQVAQSMAMNKVFADLAAKTRDSNRAALKALEVVADTKDRVLQGLGVNQGSILSHIAMDGGSGRGAGLARAAISMIMQDPRFKGSSAENIKFALRDKYYAILGDALDAFRKGTFGKQRGEEGLYDIVREIFAPNTTGNEDAAAFAKAYMQVNKVAVADRNNAGGSLNYLDKYIPQRQNAVKLLNTPFDKWKDDMNGALDWNRMTWPDGSPIKPNERDKVLQDVYKTFSTDGSSKIEPGVFNGRGSSIGSQLEDHRFLHYKDADSWIKIHEAYSDGNPAEIIFRHIDNMADKTALIQQFGRNPKMWLENTKAIIEAEAAKLAQAKAEPGDIKAVQTARAVIKNKLEPIFEGYTRANPMDPESPLAAGLVATSNVLTSAKLGSVLTLAAMGDFHQTLAMRYMNNLPLLDGMGTYLKGISTDYKALEKRAGQLGYIYDGVVGATYTTERFSPVASVGPQLSRRISDISMRLSGLNRHTDVARATVQQELMALLHNSIESKYDELPFTRMMQKYGIGEAEWDAVRKDYKPFEPEPGTYFFRPLDILDSKLPNKDDMYTRFYSMVNQESKYAVPGATLEAAISLKGNTRPDTLPGALLHSFSMYKNFPLTFMQMYGRVLLSDERIERRIGYFAAMGVGATLVGAMGVQLREMTKGREPMPMDRWQFWGKAALSGGGLGIWGDFLFNGVNEFGGGPASTVAGPLVGLAKDSIDLAFGEPFKYVSAFDKSQDYETKFAARAVQFLKANTPGTSLWWGRLALEREVWDALEQLADPNAYRKQKARATKQKNTYGNDYFSPPGSGLTGDGPLLTR